MYRMYRNRDVLLQPRPVTTDSVLVEPADTVYAVDQIGYLQRQFHAGSVFSDCLSPLTIVSPGGNCLPVKSRVVILACMQTSVKKIIVYCKNIRRRSKRLWASEKG